MINIPDIHVDQYIKISKDKAIQLDVLQEECEEDIQGEVNRKTEKFGIKKGESNEQFKYFNIIKKRTSCGV